MEVTTLAIEKLKEVMEEQGETNGSRYLPKQAAFNIC